MPGSIACGAAVFPTPPWMGQAGLPAAAARLRRRHANGPTLTHLTDTLRREHRLIAQTIYECPSCNERLLGERRCGDCNRMCRKVGLGGECSGCAEILTVADLLGTDLEGGVLA